MNIILLTHEREFDRKTGTGPLTKEILGDKCNIIPWKRKEPSPLIEKKLAPETTLLLYPTEDAEVITKTNVENIILLDGTWQEARKIYNKSPYLKRFKPVSLPNNLKSQYTLRRNQKLEGLSTVESVMEIFRLGNDNLTADKLYNKFKQFQCNIFGK